MEKEVVKDREKKTEECQTFLKPGIVRPKLQLYEFQTKNFQTVKCCLYVGNKCLQKLDYAAVI